MRVLLTGGAGFIGSWVTKAIEEAGHIVMMVDDLSTGKKENIPPNIKFVKLDIRESKLNSLFKDFKPEVVVHLAAQASVSLSVKFPLKDFDVNLCGGLNLLECCRLHGVQRFLFASTGGAIYGNVSSGRAKEEWLPHPESPYAAAKASFEIYMSVYAQLWGIEYTVLRYANIYGPRQDPFGEAGVLAIFCEKLCKGEQPTIYAMNTPADGGCLRDYLYVEDAARAVLIALEQGATGIFNIGTGIATSTQQIFDLLSEISGVSIEPIHTHPRKGDIERSVLDITKARENLYWMPQISMVDGLNKTWEFFAKNYGT